MKKLLGVLIVAITMISSTFALGLSIGGKGFMGGSFDKLQNDVLKGKDVSKLNYGGGIYVDLELLGGLGAKAEANYTHNNVTGINYFDIPLMGWYELSFFDRVILGVGGGVNFSRILSTNDNFGSVVNSVAKIGDWHKDMAVGADLKIFFTKHIGLVIGANGVFQMHPSDFFYSLFKGDLKEIADTKSGALRKDLYGSIGLEFRLF